MADKGTWDIGVLLATIADGELREEVSDEIKTTIEQLYERARNANRAVKGTITIALDIGVGANGLVVIDPNVTSKLPRKVRRETPLYIGRNGLTVENPKQQALPLREVGGAAREVREPGSRAEGQD